MAGLLMLLVILPLCTGTPASLGALGGFSRPTYGGGSRGGTSLHHTMMDMAARMMAMAAGGGSARTMKTGHAGHHGGWTSHSNPAPRHGFAMDMLPRHLQAAAAHLSEQVGKVMGPGHAAVKTDHAGHHHGSLTSHPGGAAGPLDMLPPHLRAAARMSGQMGKYMVPGQDGKTGYTDYHHHGGGPAYPGAHSGPGPMAMGSMPPPPLHAAGAAHLGEQMGKLVGLGHAMKTGGSAGSHHGDVTGHAGGYQGGMTGHAGGHHGYMRGHHGHARGHAGGHHGGVTSHPGVSHGAGPGMMHLPPPNFGGAPQPREQMGGKPLMDPTQAMKSTDHAGHHGRRPFHHGAQGSVMPHAMPPTFPTGEQQMGGKLTGPGDATKAGPSGRPRGWTAQAGIHRHGPPVHVRPPPLHAVASRLGEQMGGKFMDLQQPPAGHAHIGEKFVGPHSPPVGGTSGMGNAPTRPGGSSQLHIMEKLYGAPKDSAVTPPAQKFTPVGVGADYSYFAGKLAGGNVHGGLPSSSQDQHATPLADLGHPRMESHLPGSQPAKDLHYHDHLTPSPDTVNGDILAKGNNSSVQNPKFPPPPTSLTTLPNLPSAEQLVMSNLFSTGQEKADHKQVVPEPQVSASSKNRGLGPIPGLTVPLHGTPQAATNTANMALRAPCDLLVDAVFALDDMKNLWLAQEAIRYYETQLLPSRQTRFGVVLCGRQKSFYTALHHHFSALLASLEDLQHANATLDPGQHMPDTPGYRSSNNPYPPRVSEDFAQIDAGCLETAYHLFMYQGHPNVERLLTVVGTKERWANTVAVEEARFLHSLNISLLTLADGALSPPAQDSMRKMASTPDKFRSVSDNVTLHAMPAMIGSAICRPQKADVTVAVQRTETGSVQDPVMTDCQQVNPMTMRRTQDFGRFFGLHTDHVQCPAGLHPDLRLCACV